MREKMYHVDLRDVFVKFGREKFTTSAFFNFMSKRYFPDGREKHSMDDYDIGNLLSLFNKRRLVIRIETKDSTTLLPKNVSIKDEKSFSFSFSFEFMERWRISGKAIFELNEVFEDFYEEPTPEDYSEVAILSLVED